MIDVEVMGISWDKYMVKCRNVLSGDEKWLKVSPTIDIKSVRKGSAFIGLDSDGSITVISSREKVGGGASTTPAIVPASNYVSRDDKVQKYIIRQSCLKCAVEATVGLFGQAKPVENMNMSATIKSVAEDFEKWVNRE